MLSMCEDLCFTRPYIPIGRDVGEDPPLVKVLT